MQNGFRLIIRMVREENPVGRLVGQGLVSNPARRSFKSFAGPQGDRYPKDGDRDAKAAADFAAGIGPGVGLTAKAVMNMKRRKAQARVTDQAICRVQQYRGIEPAGKAHGDRLTWPGTAGKAGGYRLHNDLSGWLVP
jgi:hypothetical protein